MRRRVAVIGAGAAGLVAAAHAAEAGAEVTLLERTPDGGRKILISGGGRCNVLPEQLAPDRFVTESSSARLRALLRSWPLEAQRVFFAQTLGVPLALEAETRKYFPVSGRARDVRDALVAHARRCGAVLRGGVAVRDVEPQAQGWRVLTADGVLDVDAVVIATGGLSVPTTGSDGTGLRVAAALGHLVHPPYAALTPLVADPVVHAELAGVSLPVRIRARDAGRETTAQGGFLFTHRGYSGPAVLDVSHVAVRSRLRGTPARLLVQWGTRSRDEWTGGFATARGLVVNAVGQHLPQRLAEWLVTQGAGIPPDRTVPQLRRAERTALVDHLTAYVLPWTGDEGYRKAEVTGGGVDLDDVRPDTLESRRAPGLHFCGEVLDAFGPIGGHNFAWAWSTGRLAGLGAARGPA